MSKIFLNYRRQDSAAFAGRLYDHFVEHFGQDSVFIDIDTISLGVDFVEAIQEKMAICEVLLVLIGKQWLTCSDTAGRRLDNPNDFVRLEIVAAKDRGIRIIPVLVDGAEMPREELLPDALRFLARRNATELSYLRFRDDVNRLIRSIENVINTGRRISEVGPVAPPPSPIRFGGRNRWGWAAGATIILMGGGIWIATVGSRWVSQLRWEARKTSNTVTNTAFPVKRPPTGQKSTPSRDGIFNIRAEETGSRSIRVDADYAYIGDQTGEMITIDVCAKMIDGSQIPGTACHEFPISTGTDHLQVEIAQDVANPPESYKMSTVEICLGAGPPKGAKSFLCRDLSFSKIWSGSAGVQTKKKGF